MTLRSMALGLCLLQVRCVSNRVPASSDHCPEAATRLLEVSKTLLDPGPLRHHYNVVNGWLQFSSGPLTMPRQGFKMHVSYRSPDEVALIFKAISPTLVEQKFLIRSSLTSKTYPNSLAHREAKPSQFGPRTLMRFGALQNNSTRF